MILAIDIGGTKFTMAAFDGDRMVRRESRATDAAGGREWMIGADGRDRRRAGGAISFERCGIGFGGPVNFAAQRVVLSTHVGGWRDFDLCGFVTRSLTGAPAVMDNDANVGAIGEAEFGAGRGCSPLFYMTLSTGIGGGIYEDGPRLAGRRFLRRRNRPPHHPARWPGVPVRRARLLGTDVLRPLAARDHGKARRELMQDPEFVARYVVDLALGLKAAIMLLNPRAHRHRRRHRKAGDAFSCPCAGNWGGRLPPGPRPGSTWRRQPLSDDSVLFGALSLARRHGVVSG